MGKVMGMAVVSQDGSELDLGSQRVVMGQTQAYTGPGLLCRSSEGLSSGGSASGSGLGFSSGRGLLLGRCDPGLGLSSGRDLLVSRSDPGLSLSSHRGLNLGVFNG